MGRTYTNLTVHAIFSTKYRRKIILPSFKSELYKYIGGIIRNKKGVLLEIGGIQDHVHLLAGFPPTIAVSDMLRFIKSNSSGWVNELSDNQLTEEFAWQPGFGAFSVSYSQQTPVGNYIRNQEEHHKKSEAFKRNFWKF